MDFCAGADAVLVIVLAAELMCLLSGAFALRDRRRL
jgi:hypothetical protein